MNDILQPILCQQLQGKKFLLHVTQTSNSRHLFLWFILCFFAPIGNSSFSVCHINPKLSLLLPLVICVGHIVDLGHMAWKCKGFGPPAGPFSYFIFPLALPPKICFLLIQRDSVKVDFYLTVIFQDTLNLKAFYSVFKTEAFPRWRSI